MRQSDEQSKERRRFVVALLTALGVHVAVLFISLFLQLRQQPEPAVVTVSLVSLPGPGAAVPEPPGGGIADVEPQVVELPEKEAAEIVKPLAEPVVKPEKQAVPIEPVKPEKKAEPAKTAEKLPEKPEKSMEETLKKLQETVSGKQPSEIEKTLARLQQKVDTEGPPSSLYNRAGGIGRGAGAGTGNYGAPLSPYEQYLSQVVMIITQSWSFSGELIREQGSVEAYVALTILLDGAVTDVAFDRHSSSNYFDETVKKALEKASPLPPVPADVSLSPLRIGLIFTPRGIE